MGRGSMTPSRIWHHVPSARGFSKSPEKALFELTRKPGSLCSNIDNSTEESTGLIHATLTLRTTIYTPSSKLYSFDCQTRLASIASRNKLRRRNSGEVDPGIFSPDKDLVAIGNSSNELQLMMMYLGALTKPSLQLRHSSLRLIYL